jgi:spermidine synthase
MHQHMKGAGFSAVQTLQFPQLCYPSGWWTATMAMKGGDLKAFKSQAAKEKSFTTKYYNEAIHEAAFAQPSFVKVVLDEI